MKYLILLITTTIVGCATSKTEKIEKYSPPTDKVEVLTFKNETLHKMELEKKSLAKQLQEKDEEIRAYRAHLGLPQKGSGKKIEGYTEEGQAIFKDGSFDTVEEELDILKQKKEEPKPQPVRVIQSTPKAEVPSAPKPNNKDGDDVLKAFGF